MAFEQVVITLTPVYSPDTLPFRSLTFSSDSDTIPIGRASKSEVKNLLPEIDNGWFNSRVMSRNHAVLSVRMEKKAVFVRDHGSLHGTQLNDVKIKPKENVSVNSGDVLTFGSEISRGTETFRPIAVRLDCQWHESKQADSTSKDTSKPISNTFSVPDDDEDDVVEIVESRAVYVRPKTPQNVSDSSDVDYGSDMSRPLDLTSPLTSPEAKISELSKLTSAGLKNAGDSQHEPNLESRDVELPKFISSESLRNEDGSQFDSEEEGSNSESEASADDQTKGLYDEDSESESDASEDDQDETSSLHEKNPMRYHILKSSYDPSAHQYETPHTPPPPDFMAPEPVASSAQPDFAANIQEPTPNLPEQSCHTTNSVNYTVPWPEYFFPRVPSPSDKAMAKPMGTTAPNYQPYNDNSSSFEMWSNNQGPPQPSYQDPVNLTNPYGSITANESFPFGPHRSSGYLRHLAGNLLGEGQTPMSNEKPFESISLRHSNASDANSAANKEIEKTTETPKTRLSIADIVEKSATQSAVSNERKRKADDFDLDVDLVGESKELGSTEDSIPDAQPRPDMQNTQPSEALSVGADPLDEVQLNYTQGPRHKRIKTKEFHSFMKYATVAAIGAVVGSIGTIAGLASLPADFFN